MLSVPVAYREGQKLRVTGKDLHNPYPDRSREAEYFVAGYHCNPDAVGLCLQIVVLAVRAVNVDFCSVVGGVNEISDLDRISGGLLKRAPPLDRRVVVRSPLPCLLVAGDLCWIVPSPVSLYPITGEWMFTCLPPDNQQRIQAVNKIRTDRLRQGDRFKIVEGESEYVAVICDHIFAVEIHTGNCFKRQHMPATVNRLVRAFPPASPVIVGNNEET